MRELFLQLKQLLAFLPLVVWLRESLEVRLVKLSLGFLGLNSFDTFAFLLLFGHASVVDVFLDDTEGVKSVDFVSWHEVNQIQLAVAMRDLYNVKSKWLLSLGL